MVIALKNMSVLDFYGVCVVVHGQLITIFVVFNLRLVLILLLSLQVRFAYGQGLISGAYLNKFSQLWCPLTEGRGTPD
jgi:hypothetical protein